MKLHFLIASCLAACSATAQLSSGSLNALRATAPVVDSMYRAHASTNHFPGMVYAVIANGQILFTGSAGSTDISRQIAASDTSAFRIASMSKSFTALAILQLRDAGKLNLDDPASRYIPELRSSQLLTTDAPPITIRHLLTHAAGLPEDNPWGDRQLDATDQELLQLSRQLSFSTTPGTQYEYSNVGFALLGRIISVVSKMPYQQYITRHIFQPLGMNHTYWEYDKVPSTSLAHGYRWMGKDWKEEKLLHDGAYGAMGGIITTAQDFARYMQLHMSAWPAHDGPESPVIKRSSLREMHTPAMFNNMNAAFTYSNGRNCALTSAYAMGLRWMADCENRVMIGHTGGLPGFGSNWIFMPAYHIGVLFFGNVTYAPTSLCNMQVLETMIRRAGLKKNPVAVSTVLQKRKEALMQVLPEWKESTMKDLFAENFFLDYDISTLRKESQLLFAKAGRIVSIEEIEPENQLRGAFLIRGEQAVLQVSFTLTPEARPRIQEYHIREWNQR